jgi:ABC-type branched-subunit amino acid transport system substrate-binding protein
VAYLRLLGREPVPGITGSEVRVGALMPAAGPLSGAAGEVKALLAAFFDDLNAGGGLFGRKVRFVPVPYDPEAKDGAVRAVRDLISGAPVFCFIANLGVPFDGDAAKLLASESVPVVAPLLVTPTGSYDMDRNTFYLYASLYDQARVMVDFVAGGARGSSPRISLVYPMDKSGEGGAAGARDQAGKYGISPVSEEKYVPGRLDAPGTVGRLRGGGVETIMFFGGEADALRLLREAGRHDWHPDFLCPAVTVGGGISSLPFPLVERVFLASPLGGTDHSSIGMGEFMALVEKHRLQGGHKSFQLMAFAGAKLLAEGLRLSGRAVTRESFINRIGSLYSFRTGVAPPLSYNENRRIGSSGASIMRLDGASRQFVPAAEWREPR